jgi:hypothetical protein
MDKKEKSLILRNINAKIHNTKTKQEVWVANCGKIYEVKCPISWCENQITSFDFHIGFIKPIKYKDSKNIDIKNLIPLCRRCSSSMNNIITFEEWNKKYKLIKLKPLNEVKIESKKIQIAEESKFQIENPIHKDNKAVIERIEKKHTECIAMPIIPNMMGVSDDYIFSKKPKKGFFEKISNLKNLIF